LAHFTKTTSSIATSCSCPVPLAIFLCSAAYCVTIVIIAGERRILARRSSGICRCSRGEALVYRVYRWFTATHNPHSCHPSRALPARCRLYYCRRRRKNQTDWSVPYIHSSSLGHSFFVCRKAATRCIAMCESVTKTQGGTILDSHRN